MTKYVEYLRQGRTTDEIVDACHRLGLDRVATSGLAKARDSLRVIGLLTKYFLWQHQDFEICAMYVGTEPLSVLIVAIWTPLALVLIYREWRQRRLEIDAKKKLE